MGPQELYLTNLACINQKEPGRKQFPAQVVQRKNDPEKSRKKEHSRAKAKETTGRLYNLTLLETRDSSKERPMLSPFLMLFIQHQSFSWSCSFLISCMHSFHFLSCLPCTHKDTQNPEPVFGYITGTNCKSVISYGNCLVCPTSALLPHYGPWWLPPGLESSFVLRE